MHEGADMPLVCRLAPGYRVGGSHPRAVAPDAVVEQARAMRDRGRSYGQIAAKLGINRYTVRDWVTCRTR